MGDYINYLFFNVDLFPLYEVIVWLLFFVIIYLLYCVFKKFFAVKVAKGR